MQLQSFDFADDVVEQAVAFSGMRQVPIEDRTRLLTDNGSGYLARAFEEYLSMLSIRHVYRAPHHPQTNGKIERFHETVRGRLNLLVYTSCAPQKPHRVPICLKMHDFRTEA